MMEFTSLRQIYFQHWWNYAIVIKMHSGTSLQTDKDIIRTFQYNSLSKVKFFFNKSSIAPPLPCRVSIDYIVCVKIEP